jgi:hypothetical protein
MMKDIANYKEEGFVEIFSNFLRNRGLFRVAVLTGAAGVRPRGEER